MEHIVGNIITYEGRSWMTIGSYFNSLIRLHKQNIVQNNLVAFNYKLLVIFWLFPEKWHSNPQHVLKLHTSR
jgi:hypothetical protein